LSRQPRTDLANASHHSNLDYRHLAREILSEADAVDAAEDQLFGDAQGDELPEALQTAEGRRAALGAAKRKLHERAARENPDTDRVDDPEAVVAEIVLDAEAIVARQGGRKEWFREARRQLDRQRVLRAWPVPRSRPERLLEAELRMQEDLAVERHANAAYEAYREHGRTRDGRRFGARPTPYTPPDEPAGRINTTDPDSRNVKTPRSYTQGYNVQAAVNEQQIVLAAEVTASSSDFGHLTPIVDALLAELEAISVTEAPGVVVADAWYWHDDQMDNVAGGGIPVLIPPDAGDRNTPRPGWTGGRYDWMRAVLATEHGKALYRKRQVIVEPVFGQTKHNRRIASFQRCGRSAARSEWRLIAATHNLMKLHKRQQAQAA
jgi:Transposase DDE domain